MGRKPKDDRPFICCNTGEIFTSRKECCDVYNISATNLSQCLLGYTKGYKGLRFMFVEDYEAMLREDDLISEQYEREGREEWFG